MQTNTDGLCLMAASMNDYVLCKTSVDTVQTSWMMIISGLIFHSSGVQPIPFLGWSLPSVTWDIFRHSKARYGIESCDAQHLLCKGDHCCVEVILCGLWPDNVNGTCLFVCMHMPTNIKTTNKNYNGGRLLVHSRYYLEGTNTVLYLQFYFWLVIKWAIKMCLDDSSGLLDADVHKQISTEYIWCVHCNS